MTAIPAAVIHALTTVTVLNKDFRSSCLWLDQAGHNSGPYQGFVFVVNMHAWLALGGLQSAKQHGEGIS